MNPLWTGFDPDVAKALMVLGAIIIAIIATEWFAKPRPKVSEESLPFPKPPDSQPPELISSGEALRRMICARTELLNAVRSGNRPLIRATAYTHSDALADYRDAIGRELTK